MEGGGTEMEKRNGARRGKRIRTVKKRGGERKFVCKKGRRIQSMGFRTERNGTNQMARDTSVLTLPNGSRHI